jgi:hypothetical protein
MNGEFSGTEVDVGGRLSETFEVPLRERRKQRDCPDFVNRQHGSLELVFNQLGFILDSVKSPSCRPARGMMLIPPPVPQTPAVI